ncbi:hypothetical protein WBQ88_08300 [Sphingopyxis sp. CCNWLW253]|uniref:hypothetical protein n=1 Tax=unclassified Sphingopyxis TaxID=2614943 RepID=UPI003012EC4A
MDFENIALRPGEFALYLKTNDAVDLRRLIALLNCFTFVGEDGIIPAYRLEVVDLQKKCIFGRFSFRWWSNPPDEKRLEQMEQEIARLRADLDGSAVVTAQATLDQAAEAYKSRRIAEWSLVLAVMGLIYDVAHDALSEQPNRCASAIADLMELDNVSSVKVWSTDCTAIIEKRHVSEVQRRERGVHAAVGTAHSVSSAYGEGAYGVNSSKGLSLLQQKDTISIIDHPQHYAPDRESLFSAAPDQVSRHLGRIEQHGDMFILIGPPNPDGSRPPPLILIPPAHEPFRMWHSYEVEGRIFRTPADYDLLVAQRVTDRGVLGK